MFNKHFLEFIGLLKKHEVDFLIVGGYAVGVHGFPRYRGDLLANKAASPKAKDKIDLEELRRIKNR